MKAQKAFSLLANTDRCQVIRRLVAEDGTSTVDALAEHVAARFEEADVEQAKVALVHNHLPRLEAADVVEHSNGVVVLTGTGADLVPLLEAATEIEGDEPELTANC